VWQATLDVCMQLWIATTLLPILFDLPSLVARDDFDSIHLQPSMCKQITANSKGIPCMFICLNVYVVRIFLLKYYLFTIFLFIVSCHFMS
jgi:hypothetical protein